MNTLSYLNNNFFEVVALLFYLIYNKFMF